MLKSRFVVLAFLSAIALLSDSGVDAEVLCTLDPCDDSEASGPAGILFSCPQGDGDSLGEQDLVISVTARDCNGAPLVNIPPSEIWVAGCSAGLLNVCNGGVGASGPTDANGHTTITGAIAAGGCDPAGIRVIVQGSAAPNPICSASCIPIQVRSVDITGNLVVDLADFAQFGAGYTSPPKAYSECIDYIPPFGSVNLGDFAKFGTHYQHAC